MIFKLDMKRGETGLAMWKMVVVVGGKRKSGPKEDEI
jgi:hypothetical protein